jgi:aminoglycoside phosphotransferase family enzyme
VFAISRNDKQSYSEKIMASDNLPPFITALLDQSVYPHEASGIRLVQTHISFVILAGDYVYKFKKPVDFGFLDFSTLEKRKHCCEQELLLNRRLCPDIYLDLVTVNRAGDAYCLNGEGEVVEYGVKMARMPEERMMVNIIRAGKLEHRHIDSLVEVLAPFYERAERSTDIDRFGTAEAVGVNVLENFDQTRDFVGTDALSSYQFDTIASYARGVLARSDLFTERISRGRIRDCHGDLYSANICLADKVYIYDCIEFNQRFRYCDVASDVGFLAMDLDYWGLEELSNYCIERFTKLSGDGGLAVMLDFYKCYRAYVRGKIGLFTANDPAVDESVRQQNLDAAVKYFQLAQQYATR